MGGALGTVWIFGDESPFLLLVGTSNVVRGSWSMRNNRDGTRQGEVNREALLL